MSAALDRRDGEPSGRCRRSRAGSSPAPAGARRPRPRRGRGRGRAASRLRPRGVACTTSTISASRADACAGRRIRAAGHRPFARRVAGAEAEHDAPTRQLIERGRVAREREWIAHTAVEDVGAEPQRRRDGRGRGRARRTATASTPGWSATYNASKPRSSSLAREVEELSGIGVVLRTETRLHPEADRPGTGHGQPLLVARAASRPERLRGSGREPPLPLPVSVRTVTGPMPNGEPSAFMRAAGLQLDEVGATLVTGWIDLGPEHHQPWGLVHGGVYTTAIETAASVGASTAAAEHGLVAVGVNNNTNFVRSTVSGRVDVHAVRDPARPHRATLGGAHHRRRRSTRRRSVRCGCRTSRRGRDRRRPAAIRGRRLAGQSPERARERAHAVEPDRGRDVEHGAARVGEQTPSPAAGGSGAGTRATSCRSRRRTSGAGCVRRRRRSRTPHST